MAVNSPDPDVNDSEQIIILSNIGNQKNSTNKKSMTKRRIIKNLVSLAFGHFLVFTAFDSLSNLQSTINSERSIGIASQALIYACFTVSSFFLPTLIIKKFGCKTALVLSVFSISPYVAANMFPPQWATLLPTAAISGLAFGPLWAARSTYVNEISYQYSRLIDGQIAVVNAWFFGIYSFFHENAEIWGNVISYLVLKTSNSTEIPAYNWTSLTCGSAFCSETSPQNVNPNLMLPPEGKRFTLGLIYVALIIVAGIVIKILLDPIESEESVPKQSSCKLLVATFEQLKKRNQLLLLPISFYCGFADGFYNTDFTKSFIACSSGISHVGFVTISYGVVCAIMDCMSGFFVNRLGRVKLFVFAAFSHFVMFTACLVWTPNPENSSYVLFILAGVYGLGASVWWSQIAAFYGVVFKSDEEAAFSNFYFWSSVGLLVAYGYSDYVCTKVKLFLLIGLLAISIATYLIVEMRTSEVAIIRRKTTEGKESESPSLRLTDTTVDRGD